jgi:hypothetical protein
MIIWGAFLINRICQGNIKQPFLSQPDRDHNLTNRFLESGCSLCKEGWSRFIQQPNFSNVIWEGDAGPISAGQSGFRVVGNN